MKKKINFKFHFRILLPPLFNTFHFVYFIFLAQPLKSRSAIAHFKTQFDECFRKKLDEWNADGFQDGKCIFVFSCYDQNCLKFMISDSMEVDNVALEDPTSNETSGNNQIETNFRSQDGTPAQEET